MQEEGRPKEPDREVICSECHWCWPIEWWSWHLGQCVKCPNCSVELLVGGRTWVYPWWDETKPRTGYFTEKRVGACAGPAND